MKRSMRRGVVAWSAVAWSAVAWSACGSLDYEFDFSHESPTYVIDSAHPGVPSLEPGVTASELLDAQKIEFTGGWTGFRFDPDVGELPPELIGITVRGVSLVVTDVASAEHFDASFVERLELYVLGVGELPSFLLATYTRGEDRAEVEDGVVELSVVEEVNLKEYLSAGAEFYCFLQGTKPESKTAVQLLVDFYAYTRANP